MICFGCGRKEKWWWLTPMRKMYSIYDENAVVFVCNEPHCYGIAVEHNYRQDLDKTPKGPVYDRRNLEG